MNNLFKNIIIYILVVFLGTRKIDDDDDNKNNNDYYSYHPNNISIARNKTLCCVYIIIFCYLNIFCYFMIGNFKSSASVFCK